MEKTFTAKDTDDLEEIAEKLMILIDDRENDGADPFNIVLFYGSMGAGKTTLIRALCNAMHVTDPVTSPTFALINEYGTEYGRRIYHFDFYRIESLEEVFDLGYEEYFYSPDLSLIEWPEKIEPLLPDPSDRSVRVGRIDIEANSKGDRTITFRG